MAASKFHPALSVTNIKNLIPITLEMEKSQYNSWVELFKIHRRVYLVLDHILPTPPPSSSTATKEKDKEQQPPPPDDPALWSRLDAVFLQWIYGTTSNDLLRTILEPDTTAAAAWASLKNIFQDNKHSRVYLERQFTNNQLDDFPNASAYCQELKVLADQLSNVEAPVSNNRLVLQLIAGLNENYDGVATLIQQTDPLPPFYEALSKLMEETRKNQQTPSAANTAGTALLSTKSSSPPVAINRMSTIPSPLHVNNTLHATTRITVVVVEIRIHLVDFVGVVAVDSSTTTTTISRSRGALSLLGLGLIRLGPVRHLHSLQAHGPDQPVRQLVLEFSAQDHHRHMQLLLFQLILIKLCTQCHSIHRMINGTWIRVLLPT